jgi:hypothetical protein
MQHCFVFETVDHLLYNIRGFERLFDELIMIFDEDFQ